jgi:large subunit ribosomal protein L23
MNNNSQNKIVIVRPRVTEKSSAVSEKGVYVFEVGKDTNKKEIARNIIEVYKVTPLKINITTNPGKKITAKGKVGRSRGVKKAYVYLRAGDKIEI